MLGRLGVTGLNLSNWHISHDRLAARHKKRARERVWSLQPRWSASPINA